MLRFARACVACVSGPSGSEGVGTERVRGVPDVRCPIATLSSGTPHARLVFTPSLPIASRPTRRAGPSGTQRHDKLPGNGCRHPCRRRHRSDHRAGHGRRRGGHGAAARPAGHRLLDGALPGPADIREWVHGFAESVGPPGRGRVGRARGDALAGDPGGRQDRPLRLRGHWPSSGPIRPGSRCRSSTRSCSGATRASACRSWAPRSPSPGSSAPARPSSWASGCRSASARRDEPQVGAFCVVRARRRLGRLLAAHAAPATTRPSDEWVLNGQKAWATNGGIANVHVVVASVDPRAGLARAGGLRDPARHQGPRDGHQGEEARVARLAHRRRVPRRLPGPGLVPARRQGEARRAPGPRPGGHAGQEPGGDADLRGQPADGRRPGARHRPRRLRVRARLREGARRSSDGRSSRTRRSPSPWPT